MCRINVILKITRRHSYDTLVVSILHRLAVTVLKPALTTNECKQYLAGVSDTCLFNGFPLTQSAISKIK